jgi:hypothetical protein
MNVLYDTWQALWRMQLAQKQQIGKWLFISRMGEQMFQLVLSIQLSHSLLLNSDNQNLNRSAELVGAKANASCSILPLKMLIKLLTNNGTYLQTLNVEQCLHCAKRSNVWKTVDQKACSALYGENIRVLRSSCLVQGFNCSSESSPKWNL